MVFDICDERFDLVDEVEGVDGLVEAHVGVEVDVFGAFVIEIVFLGFWFVGGGGVF